MKRLLPIATTIVFLACSFFEPREPEYPDPGEEIPWQQPYAPQTVVTNLENAMEGRSITMSMACLDSSFVFIADGADTTEFGGSFDFGDWTYEVEQNTLMNIYNFVQGSGLSRDSLIAVTMTVVPELPDPVAPSDSAVLWRDYEIVAAGCEYADWQNPARGRIKFTMLEDDYGLWFVGKWNDYRPEGYSGGYYTWGVAKASFR